MERRRRRSHSSTSNKPVTRSPTFCPMAVISFTSCKGIPRFVVSTWASLRWAGDTKAVRCRLRGGLHLGTRALRPSGTALRAALRRVAVGTERICGFRIADDVSGSQLAGVSASAEGVLAFRTGSVSVERQFVWFDRSGKGIGTVGDADSEKLFPSASPDLAHVAFFGRVNGNVDIWVLETRRHVLSRFSDTCRR